MKYLGYKRYHDTCWCLWFGPIQITAGAALSIWIWLLLVTIDGHKISLDWNPD